MGKQGIIILKKSKTKPNTHIFPKELPRKQKDKGILFKRQRGWAICPAICYKKKNNIKKNNIIQCHAKTRRGCH